MRRTINGGPGLVIGPNTEAIPPGALKQSVSMYMRDVGMLEQTRPLRQLTIQSLAGFANPPQHIAAYGTQIMALTSSGYYTAAAPGLGNVYTALTAPISTTPPDTADTLRFAEASGNLYVVGAAGFLKWDTAGANPYITGIPRALDVQLTLVAAGTLLANTNSVGYRVLFGFLDANQNLILGPPSGRAVTTATAAQNISGKAWIPSAITAASNATSYFVQVYRTPIQTVVGADPGEEMQIVYQSYLTATDVGNKFITFTDFTPDALRGAQGYFCPSQEGLAFANYQPPIAQDCALFKQAMFYSNTKSKHRARVQLLGVGANLLTISTAAGGITKSGGNGVYTFTGSPDLSNIVTDGTAKLSVVNCTSAANNGEFPITAVNTGAFTITVTNAAAVTEAGAATARAFPSKLTISGVNYYGVISATAETPASQLFKVSTGFAIAGTGTPQQDVRDTCASLLRVVNQQATPTVYGYYESGPDDGAGKMLFEEVSIGGSQFSLSAGGTLLYSSFNPTIPVAAPWKSQNDVAINRLYFSKYGQPEHVPLVNYFDIGSKSKSILRIIPLREALLVFKQDGLFRVTGDGSVFSVSEYDRSMIAVSKTAVLSSNNRAYAVSPFGLAEISESSVRYVSRQVDRQLRQYTEQYTGAFPTAQFYLWSNDIDHTVGLFLTMDQGKGPKPSLLIYSGNTETWGQLPTTDINGVYSAFYNQAIKIDGVPYRVDANGTIWSDDGFIDPSTNAPLLPIQYRPLPGHKVMMKVTAHSVVASTVTYDNTVMLYGQPGVGSVVWDYDLNYAIVTGISVVGASTTLTLAAAFGGSSVPASSPQAFLSPQTVTLEWVPFTAGDDGNNTRFTEAAVLFDQVSTLTTATMNAYTEATTSAQIASMTSGNSPLPTGVSTQTLLRAPLPGTMQLARRLSVVFNHNTPAEYVYVRGISYKYEPLESPHEVT